jgi:hypothetical protein
MASGSVPGVPAWANDVATKQSARLAESVVALNIVISFMGRRVWNAG